MLHGIVLDYGSWPLKDTSLSLGEYCFLIVLPRRETQYVGSSLQRNKYKELNFLIFVRVIRWHLINRISKKEV